MEFDELMRLKDEETSIDERFFQLANQPCVQYRVRKSGSVVKVHQDPTVEGCSSGIVWESAFVLARYLELQLESKSGFEKDKIGQGTKVVEVGAGCGLLGIVLAHLGFDVVLTEQDGAMANLRHNVASNPTTSLAGKGGSMHCETLCWGDEKQTETVRTQGPFDILVGTDIVFHHDLVPPLLRSMRALCTERTKVFVCVQERDPKAHRVFLQLSTSMFEVRKVDLSQCGADLDFAKAVDTVLLEMTPK